MCWDVFDIRGQHVQTRILLEEVEFHKCRPILCDKRLDMSQKIVTFKISVLVTATFGCETIDLKPLTIRRYRRFFAKYATAISGRSITDENKQPSFDIIAWVRWRRAVWLGKGLRGEKGNIVHTSLHWGFQNRAVGDVFHQLPPTMTTSFFVLVSHAQDPSGWSEFCDDLKPEK